MNKILTKENGSEVRGVELSNGEEYAANIVVSNVDIHRTFKELLDGPQPTSRAYVKYMNKIESGKVSCSSFYLWLGLKENVNNRIPAYLTWLSPNHDISLNDKAIRDADPLNIPMMAVLYSKIPDANNIYENKSHLNIILFSEFKSWSKFESSYEGDKREYNIEKNRWESIVLDRLEGGYLPGIRELIDVKLSASPLTNRHWTGNREGATMGFSLTTDNSFFTRIDNHTPIKGLYIAGQWANPSGGLFGTALAARRTVQLIHHHNNWKFQI